jgi:predicted lipid-binding transport protein (Tim44 family)
MIALTNDTFIRMQNAWQERNMDLVKDIVTERLYADYKKQLDWQKVKHEQNMIEDITIKKTEIIGLEDRLGNTNDSFTVFIKGKLVDYTKSDKTDRIYENSSKKKTAFVDLYYFVRENDHWLLDKIDNQVSLGKILKSKEIVE